MSNEYGCADVDAVAAELALGVLSGPERAAALAHVEGCPACAALVDELARTGDRLLGLARPAPPPEGFESRVLARLGHAAEAAPVRRRRLWLAAAAVLLVVVGGAAGAVAFRDRHPARTVVEATMRTSAGKAVGEVYVDRGWIFMTVPNWNAPSYALDVTFKNGNETTVASAVSLDAGGGAWGMKLDLDPGGIESVALVGPDGRVWCSATLST